MAKLVREVRFPPVRGVGVQQRPLGGVIGRPNQSSYESEEVVGSLVRKAPPGCHHTDWQHHLQVVLDVTKLVLLDRVRLRHCGGKHLEQAVQHAVVPAAVALTDTRCVNDDHVSLGRRRHTRGVCLTPHVLDQQR